MFPHLSKKITKVLVTLGLFYGSTFVSADIEIDDFNWETGPYGRTGELSHGETYPESPNVAGAAFVERDHIYTAGTNTVNTGDVIYATRVPFLNTAMVFNQVGDSASMSFVYDGDDGVPAPSPIIFDEIDVDLTQGGLLNALRLKVSTSTDAVGVTVRLYEDADNYAEFTGTLPNSENVYEHAFILFDEFETIVGSGVDITSVKAVELILDNNDPVNPGSPLAFYDFLIGANVPNLAINFICLTSVDCVTPNYGLGIDHFEATQQLSHTITAEILDDKNADGDIDSAALLEDSDTFRYTITISNTDDLLDASASNLVYTASFDPDYAYFIGNVTTSHGTVVLGNGVGHTSVEVNVPELADGEDLVITYDMQVEEGSQNLPSITYSHHGTIDSTDWSTTDWGAYDTDSVDVLINRFDLASTIDYTVVDGGGDNDEYPGPGETVEVTVAINNVGPNSSQNIAVFLDPIIRGHYIVDQLSSSGTGSLDCGSSTSSINDLALSTFGVIDPVEEDTVTFQFTVEEPFSFGEFSTSEVSVEVSGLCDQFSVFSYPYPLVITVDAFPEHPEAHIDADADGFPDECENDCADSELILDPSLNDTDNDNGQLGGGTNDVDTDDDNDGVDDSDDAFPYDPDADTDTDGDGMPDTCANDCADSALTTDQDDDNDGVNDVDEFDDPLDAFPLDCEASVDSDGDGEPDQFHDPLPEGCTNDANLNEDGDDDNDGVDDDEDVFPLNNAASVDTDEDGFPDAWNEGCDSTCQSESGLTLDPFINDSDNDGVPGIAGFEAQEDDFPDNAAASVDTDGDTKPDEWNEGCDEACQSESGLTLDDDDDNDGVLDVDDAFPLNPYASVDEDQDGEPDPGEWHNCDDSAGAGEEKS